MNRLSPDYVLNGLIERGLPQHIAEGFVMNFRDESGLNPGINEIAPLVPGSRGGFGLAQWTGPRRRELEAFADQRGASVADPDLQMDFLIAELHGPESNAWKRIQQARDSGEAGAAIVNAFLRPAEEHRARRTAAYTGGDYNLGTPGWGRNALAPDQGFGAVDLPQVDYVPLIEQAQQMMQPQTAPAQVEAPPLYEYQMLTNALAPSPEYDTRRHNLNRLTRG